MNLRRESKNTQQNCDHFVDDHSICRANDVSVQYLHILRMTKYEISNTPPHPPTPPPHTHTHRKKSDVNATYDKNLSLFKLDDEDKFKQSHLNMTKDLLVSAE